MNYNNSIKIIKLVSKKDIYINNKESPFIKINETCEFLIDKSGVANFKGVLFKTLKKSVPLLLQNFPYLWDYFYTEKEFRKLKLKKIINKDS